MQITIGKSGEGKQIDRKNTVKKLLDCYQNEGNGTSSKKEAAPTRQLRPWL